MVNRVLFLRRGGLGDTLLTVPTLRALRRRYPDAELHFAGVGEFAEVLSTTGVVDVARSSEDFALWSADLRRERLRRFDRVFADEPICAGEVFDPRRVEPGAPFARQLARQLGLEPLWPDDCWLRPPRPPGDGAVWLAPGSGAVAKCWPRDRWLQLAAHLAAAGRELRVLIGPVEIERDDPRAWPWPAPVGFVVEARPAALCHGLERAAQFVGNDSGPTHLAAMLGVPTVALFTATDPAVWAPVGPHVQVLGNAGAGAVIEQVARACTRA